RSLTEKSGEGISLLTADGGIIYTSPTIKQIMGYEAEEILGKTIDERVHPDDLPMVTQAKQSLLEKPGQSAMIAYRARHKDGSWRWLEATGTNLLYEPNVRAIVVNFRDITDRKEAEDALRISEERFAKAFNASPQPMVIFEAPGRRIINVNEAMIRTFGWTAG